MGAVGGLMIIIVVAVAATVIIFGFFIFRDRGPHL